MIWLGRRNKKKLRSADVLPPDSPGKAIVLENEDELVGSLYVASKKTFKV
jgi:hypothetical protein